MFKVGDVVKLKQEVIDRDALQGGWTRPYAEFLKKGAGTIIMVEHNNWAVTKNELGVCTLRLSDIEPVSESSKDDAECSQFKLERVGERVILEINGKLSKETIEKILNLVW